MLSEAAKKVGEPEWHAVNRLEISARAGDTEIEVLLRDIDFKVLRESPRR